MTEIFSDKIPKTFEERMDYGRKMLRFEIKLWIDDHAHCLQCGYVYQSVDDFLRCDPYKGHTEELSFVCATCYPEYCKTHPLLNGKYVRGVKK